MQMITIWNKTWQLVYSLVLRIYSMLLFSILFFLLRCAVKLNCLFMITHRYNIYISTCKDELPIKSLQIHLGDSYAIHNRSFSLCIFLPDYYVLFCTNSPWNSFHLSLTVAERKSSSWTIGPNGMSFK